MHSTGRDFMAVQDNIYTLDDFYSGSNIDF